MATVGRNIAAPLLFLNLIMYLIVLGFASWCLNRYINGQTNHPSFGGNGATPFFLTFSILAAVIGIASKLAGANHIRFWRNDSLAAAGSSSIVAWAVTALAMGLACKQINIGGWRGWRLRMIEAFIIILTFTQLLYLLLIHAGAFSSKYGPGYRDRDYARGDQGHGHVPGTHAGEHKPGVGTTTMAV
ncbi:AWPM-19-like family protein [Raphanus sativus]|uniref:Membrane protein PM19L-like n=1 Tax=Raphanus sativus TaxID=3726 RepID=A0A6J0MEX7_RAPSA|nr:membrane protein PM19L-like [Raphanus sativus]KAJ4874027.1 AWPM-19-like family protein [Raphanus sativus]